ncbi:MAG: putative C-S lyase [Chloroflexi bacterium]|nr:putative C-S lyase [Chloroflexota bacterium]
MQYDFDRVIDRRNTDSSKWGFNASTFGDADLLSMWVADMDFESPAPVIEALHQRAAHGIFGYPTRPASYFEAIIGWMSKRHQWEIKREWITCVPGVVPALVLALRALTQPGDKVIVQQPVYHPFAHIVHNNGRQLVVNHLKLANGRYEMDHDELERLIDARTKALILCSPHNPVGRVWTRAELERLGEICVRRNVVILSDEIHHDLVFKAFKHIPTACISDAIAQNTLTFIAPSKTFNIPGLGAAAVITSNPRLRAQYNVEVENAALLVGNVFGNIALEAAYRYGAEWLDQLLDYLQGNFDFLIAFLRERIPQIKVICPEGTYLAWLDCRALGLSDAGLRDLFRKRAKLLLNDGAMFGAGGEGFYRMNLGCPRAVLAEALDRLARAIETA